MGRSPDSDQQDLVPDLRPAHGVICPIATATGKPSTTDIVAGHWTALEQGSEWAADWLGPGPVPGMGGRGRLDHRSGPPTRRQIPPGTSRR